MVFILDKLFRKEIMTTFKLEMLKNPMNSIAWIFESNLGASGFTDGIIDRVNLCLENNGLGLCFDDIKNEVGLDTVSLDVFEFFVDYNKRKTDNLEMAEVLLINELINYYGLIKTKVEKYIINKLKN